MAEEKIIKIDRLKFRVRITRYGMARLDDLLANPYNFRIHNQLQMETLAGVIDDIGFIKPLLINDPTGHVLDGHGRIILGKRSGILELPACWTDLSLEEEKQALLYVDEITAMATIDQEKFNELLVDVKKKMDAGKEHGALNSPGAQKFVGSLFETLPQNKIVKTSIDTQGQLIESEISPETNREDLSKKNSDTTYFGIGGFSTLIDNDTAKEVLARIQANFGMRPNVAMYKLCEYLLRNLNL